MCGIVGYVGKRRAAPILIDGLYELEYRGYDSVGIAVSDGKTTKIIKKTGRVKEIESAREEAGRIGVGHTRWATHGDVTVENAHPHTYKNITLVHNGIIENAAKLKAEFTQRGEKFYSDTDSEVIAHLIANEYRGDLLGAVMRGCGNLVGSYALAVLSEEEPETIVCARMRSPLIVGKAKDGFVVASDIPAVAEDGAELYSLDDGEFSRLDGKTVTIYNAQGSEIHKEPIQFDLSEGRAERGVYRHYMRKEIDEIPKVLSESVLKIDCDSRFSDFYRVLCHAEYIQIVACGTAYHSGLCAKAAIERLCRIPVDVRIASEYRYADPIVPKGTLLFAISQSGETADTLAAVRLAKRKGACVAAIVNVKYSSLTRLADHVLYTQAGREVAVAATKSFNAQLAVLYSVAVSLAAIRGKRAPTQNGYAKKAERTIEISESVRSWVPYFVGVQSVYFIGRGADMCAALEGSLKLKEISYLPSEGYAAGELKHGTLALIGPYTPVVAIITRRDIAQKTMNAVHEAYSRGAKIFLVTCFEEFCGEKEITASVLIPKCPSEFSPILSVIPLQLLAYYTSVARGNDPDKPRNLAKSVTVE